LRPRRCPRIWVGPNAATGWQVERLWERGAATSVAAPLHRWFDCPSTSNPNPSLEAPPLFLSRWHLAVARRYHQDPPMSLPPPFPSAPFRTTMNPVDRALPLPRDWARRQVSKGRMAFGPFFNLTLWKLSRPGIFNFVVTATVLEKKLSTFPWIKTVTFWSSQGQTIFKFDWVYRKNILISRSELHPIPARLLPWRAGQYNWNVRQVISMPLCHSLPYCLVDVAVLLVLTRGSCHALVVLEQTCPEAERNRCWRDTGALDGARELIGCWLAKGWAHASNPRFLAPSPAGKPRWYAALQQLLQSWVLESSEI
jgi:hypothetical protein